MFCAIGERSREDGNRGIVIVNMAKVLTLVTAEYDAAENVLRLEKPLQGFEDHEKVYLTLGKNNDDPERPWLAFSGIMSKEDGEDFARAIEEMFPIEK